MLVCFSSLVCMLTSVFLAFLCVQISDGEITHKLKGCLLCQVVGALSTVLTTISWPYFSLFVFLCEFLVSFIRVFGAVKDDRYV
jgi:hypothetical protein